MTIWMAVTNDKYELPIAVADTAKELAKMLGLSSDTLIYSGVSKAKQRGGNSRYKKIVIQEDEDA